VEQSAHKRPKGSLNRTQLCELLPTPPEAGALPIQPLQTAKNERSELAK